MFWLIRMLTGACAPIVETGFFDRDRRAAAGGRRASCSGAGIRRRGLLFIVRGAWRRCDEGSNHISAYGVWRKGARRPGLRRNRSGETRWHRMPTAANFAAQGELP